MTEVEEMWVELAKHQPIADKQGYGTQWQCMCGLKTVEAAGAAAQAAEAAGRGAHARWAAKAAGWAAKAEWAAHARWSVSEATKSIKIANEELP